MTAQDTPNAGPLDAAQVRRFTVSRNENGLGFSNGIEPSTSGGYVLYDDFAALSQQLSEARAARLYDDTAIEKPDFWAVFSASGINIGLWTDEKLARNVLKEYEGGSIRALSERDAPQAQAVDFLTDLRKANIARNAEYKAKTAGLVLVPREPTPGMLGAWYRYKNGRRFAVEPPATDTSDVGAYKAMITAAPTHITEIEMLVEALTRIVRLDEASGHELNVRHALEAVGIASQALADLNNKEEH